MGKVKETHEFKGKTFKFVALAEMATTTFAAAFDARLIELSTTIFLMNK